LIQDQINDDFYNNKSFNESFDLKRVQLHNNMIKNYLLKFSLKTRRLSNQIRRRNYFYIKKYIMQLMIIISTKYHRFIFF